MVLSVGSRLGPYEILSALGAGGMGEVYRAKDTKLGREVALKVLPDTFTHDPERLARFRREAQVLAALNHPHIAQIHGLEEADGTQFLVLELVDGESLEKRIARGPIPTEEALAIATQIAEALEAAHDKGIVHRDLKPANIALTKEGQVKVLDFGLAKATEAGNGASFDIANSPTITSPAMMTGMGLILGTAAYMGPEQAKGRAADTRSDIWAFGCVLYEMLTGRQAFSGSEVIGTLASVLTTEPKWGALPSTTPPNIQRLLHRCLEKDPRRRLQAVGDARVEIEDALAGAAEAPPVSTRTRGSRWREGPPWSIVAVAALAVVGAAIYLTTRPRQAASGGVFRQEIVMPPGVTFNDNAALSPDGRRVAFVGAYGAGRQVYVRELDQLESYPLPSTAKDVLACFFSPEGEALGFYSWPQLTLQRVRLSDTVASALARNVTGVVGAGAFGGATWGRDGQITFTRAGELWQVPAAGGTSKQLTSLDSRNGEVAHRSPTAIGTGQVILFEVLNQRGESHIEAVSAATGVRTVLEKPGAQPRYVSSGHLLFRQGTNLFAAPFDADRLTAKPPLPVLQGVGYVVSVSGTGSLLYSEPDLRRFVWVSRDGKEEPVGEARSGYFRPALSPNGRHIALDLPNGGVWDYDLVRGSFEPLSDGEEPIWTPDGKRVIVATASGVKVVNVGSGEPGQPVPGFSPGDLPESVSPDGNTITLGRPSPDTQGDIYVGSLDGRVPSRAFANTPAYEGGSQFYPIDGRWIAYVSDVSGPTEIYVRPFPDFNRRVWRVSPHGGAEPRWSRDGTELFYRSDDWMMSVKVTNDPDNPFSQPVKLFKGVYHRSRTRPIYDVAPDGRFLMIRDEGSRRLIIIHNWIEELKARMAAGK